MDSRFLESLVKVVEAGSFAQAARVQHLTAAAISQRIRALEVELGTTLLLRNGHSTKPTEACLKLIPQAKRIISEVATLRSNMKYGRKLSPFRLGVIPSQWSAHLPKKIDVLRASSFSARVSLSINTSAALYDQVCRNEVDAIVIERPNVGLSSKLQTFMLRREALVLLHNESEKKNANEILTQRNFIEYLPDAICHNYAAKYLADHGLNPDPVCDTTSLATIKALVSDGVGVSLVPKWPGLEGNLDGLQTLEIVDASYSREIVLITTASEDQKPLVERLIDIFRDVNKVDHHDFVI